MPLVITRVKVARAPAFASRLRVRWMATKNATEVPLGTAAAEVGTPRVETPKEASVLSSEGSVGKHFNPDGAVGQVGEKIGGPFSSEGAIGSQFDASKKGVAGKVEEAVDGPRQPTNKT